MIYDQGQAIPGKKAESYIWGTGSFPQTPYHPRFLLLSSTLIFHRLRRRHNDATPSNLLCDPKAELGSPTSQDPALQIALQASSRGIMDFLMSASYLAHQPRPISKASLWSSSLRKIDDIRLLRSQRLTDFDSVSQLLSYLDLSQMAMSLFFGKPDWGNRGGNGSERRSNHQWRRGFLVGISRAVKVLDSRICNSDLRASSHVQTPPQSKSKSPNS